MENNNFKEVLNKNSFHPYIISCIDRGYCIRDISKKLKIRDSTISKRIKFLKEKGLIRISKNNGRKIYYSITENYKSECEKFKKEYAFFWDDIEKNLNDSFVETLKETLLMIKKKKILSAELEEVFLSSNKKEIMKNYIIHYPKLKSLNLIKENNGYVHLTPFGNNFLKNFILE